MLSNRVRMASKVQGLYDFYEDFRGCGVGSVPSGWWVTSRSGVQWRITDEDKGKALSGLSANTIENTSIVWSSPDYLNNFEATLKMKTTGNTGVNRADLSVVLYGTGLNETVGFYRRNGQNSSFEMSGGSSTYFFWEPEKWYYFKIKVFNGTFKAKVWHVDNEEPEEYMVNKAVNRNTKYYVGFGSSQFSGGTQFTLDSIGINLFE